MLENLMENAVQSVVEAAGEAETVEEAVTEKWLTFRLDEQLFAVSVINIEQIISMLPITEVPQYPAYARGIINLRGMVVPVVDLRVRLGKADTQDTEHTCIVVINVDDSLIGFIVDEVDAVIDIPNKMICQPPKMEVGGESGYLTGIASADSGDNQNILLIDMAKVLQRDEFDMLAPRPHDTAI